MEKDNQKIYDEWLAVAAKREKYKQQIISKSVSDFNNEADHMKASDLPINKNDNNAAIIQMIEKEAGRKRGLKKRFIFSLHKAIFKKNYMEKKILSDGKEHNLVMHVGRYKERSNSLIIAPDLIYYCVSPEKTSEYMNKLIAWYNEASAKGEYDGIELASIFHCRYISIHPFNDGNGRTVRFLVNYILRKHGYPMIVFTKEMRNYYIYTLTVIDRIIGKPVYDRAMARADQVRIFTEFIEDLVAEQMQNEIDLVKKLENTE